MHAKPKILAFAGSLRKDSYNKKLIKIAADAARKEGAEVTLIDLKDYPMPLYDADIEDASGLPEQAKKFKELLLKHDGFLIAAPEYNSTLSGVLKNVIDWASRPESADEVPLQCFKGKCAALMSASPSQLGGLRGLTHLRSLLQNINMFVVPELKTIPKADAAFAPDGTLNDAKKQEAIRNQAIALVRIARKLSA